jgi:DNA-binding XRE family transcriptional regulator
VEVLIKKIVFIPSSFDENIVNCIVNRNDYTKPGQMQQNKAIAFRIKEFREYRKLTQKNMADELDLVERSYANIENGITDPSLSKLVKITQLLGIELYDLTNIEKEVEEIIVEAFIKKKNNSLKK